jgi:hypothetical protein
MAELVVTISPDGEVTVEARGVEGPACAELLRPFDEALGAVRDRRRKPEYYRQTGRTLKEQAR